MKHYIQFLIAGIGLTTAAVATPACPPLECPSLHEVQEQQKNHGYNKKEITFTDSHGNTWRMTNSSEKIDYFRSGTAMLNDVKLHCVYTTNDSTSQARPPQHDSAVATMALPQQCSIPAAQ